MPAKLNMFLSNGNPTRAQIVTRDLANLAAVPEDFHLATTRLAWFTYQQRAAPMNSTAVPELGIITLPASIQPDILDVYKRYTWWYA